MLRKGLSSKEIYDSFKFAAENRDNPIRKFVENRLRDMYRLSEEDFKNKLLEPNKLIMPKDSNSDDVFEVLVALKTQKVDDVQNKINRKYFN